MGPKPSKKMLRNNFSLWMPLRNPLTAATEMGVTLGFPAPRFHVWTLCLPFIWFYSGSGNVWECLQLMWSINRTDKLRFFVFPTKTWGSNEVSLNLKGVGGGGGRGLVEASSSAGTVHFHRRTCQKQQQVQLPHFFCQREDTTFPPPPRRSWKKKKDASHVSYSLQGARALVWRRVFQQNVRTWNKLLCMCVNHFKLLLL